MTKLTVIAVLLLVTLAVLAERERRADLEKMGGWPVPPVQPAVVWPPGEPAPVIPPPTPHQSPPQLTIVPVPFHLDDELP